MDVTGQKTIAAQPSSVWDALHDPAMLQRCIPACEEVKGDPDTGFTAHLVHKRGLFRISLECTIELDESVPHRKIVLRAKGTNLISKGTGCDLSIELADSDQGRTHLTYSASAQINATLRKTFGTQIDTIANLGAEAFFNRLNAALTA